MIYATDRFKKKYQELSENDKQNVIKITEDLNKLSSRDYPEYLIALCGENGNSKWSGINKTLYHLYPNGQKNVHRMFYCYATDIDDDLREKAQVIDGIVFIDYTTKHDDEVKAARKYEKNQIQHLNRFEPINYKYLEKQQKAKPSFWFCLTSDQEDILLLPQPSLIKGSAGTGKTIISFELLKQWVVNNETKKYLYLTYTNNLLKKAKQAFYEDGMFIDNKRVVLSDFSGLLNSKMNKTIINEQQARKIIIEILSEYDKSNNIPRDILFTEYFIYSYIRGIIKGYFEKFYFETLDVFSAKKTIRKALEDFDFNINEKNRIMRQIIDALENKEFDDKRLRTEILRNIVSLYDNKRDRDQFTIKVLQFFDKDLIHKMGLFLEKTSKYRFFDDSLVKDKLIDEGIESSQTQILIDIKNKYNKILDDNNYIDDNDYALIILNSDILDENKFDGIIVDEVQDLTEIQIEAIVKLSKKDSKDISFFGDPNQTINPTVYDYGRFNSYVYIEKKYINRKNLKITHRCGPNLLEYINHLTQLRKNLKLTTIREDVEPEESANKNKIDTYWACLVENQEVIDNVLEIFTSAVDCFLIVDNEYTRQIVIHRIQNIIEDSLDETIIDQIITVQDAKGLESKNVIIFNLISDNLEIFKNLDTQNRKVASMTFNKFYVSTTRAEDSVIICEEKLDEAFEVKQQLFYSNGNLMLENILADDIHDYLLSSSDPERFLDQAENLIENQEYSKANKKALIALKNIINQFRDYELFNEMINKISKNNELSKIFDSYNPRDINEMNKFLVLYDQILEYCELYPHLDNLDIARKRRRILSEALRIRDVGTIVDDYEILRNDLFDSNIINDFIEKFIKLKEYHYAIKVSNNIEDMALRQKVTKIIRYCFGFETYHAVIDLFSGIEFSNPDFYQWLLENKVKYDSMSLIEDMKNNLGGLIDG